MSDESQQKLDLPKLCDVHFKCVGKHPRLGERAVLQCCKAAGHGGDHFFRAVNEDNAAALRHENV